MKSRFLALVAGLASAAWSQSGGIGGVAGGGPVGASPACSEHCIGADERESVDQLVDAFLQQGGGPASLTGIAPDPYLVYPIGGSLAGDVFIGNYVDLDPTFGVLDWNCGAYTYDGHAGIDSGIRGFDEQVIGVPIFAAQDGVVVSTHDGEPDMNVTWPNVPSNHVIVAHPGNRIAYYWHLKNGSVAVAPGQVVKAGQQIGLVGSSGVSGGPHLHFETRDNYGPVIEPFAGPCRAGDSHFLHQPAFDGTVACRDFAICRSNPGVSAPPLSPCRDAQWVQSDQWVYFWIQTYNVPANTNWRVRYVRPDGVTSLDSGFQPFNNPAYQASWWWFVWYVYDMQVFTGTWTVIIDFDAVNIVTAPFEVVTTPTPGFNRAPTAITAAIEPASPTPADVIACRVGGSLILDDLDWDVVRYQYVWKVDGVVVRSTTSAGRVDVLAHHVAQGGDIVTCDVTPSDGTASGATVVATATVRSLWSDTDQLSLSLGGTVNFQLDVGPAFGGSVYLFAGSLTGVSPGIAVAPGVTVPLVWDFWTTFMIQTPNTWPYANTLSFLDPAGRNAASLSLPPGMPPSLAGLVGYHAALVLGPSWMATNPTTMVLIP
jgi:hypothetical protein